MSLATGTRIAHYEVLGSLGAGGMGEVYRARDTKLSRDVALKILPEIVASDPERRARFGREARTLAALNHPHIAQVHGFEESAVTSALIMELVEGEDLSQRIRRGPIPYDEAIAIAKQIGQALEAAHEQGIVHRDLKPGNIKLREDGTIKVLDFGLAKAFETGSANAESAAHLANSPTITSPASLTAGGVILGTAAYMAPEQAKGRVVDKRVDIWAFGCVLYEMLTGRRAFGGDDVSDTLASVLKSDVDWTSVPPRAIRLLKKCLEKDPRRRLHDIGDAWDLIEGVSSAPTAPSTARAWIPWTLAALLLISTVALAAVLYMRPLVASSSARFQIAPPAKHAFDIYLALSPDGKRLAFTAVNAERVTTIWVRDLEQLEARQLPGTEGAWSPFWSPDGKFIGFAVDRVLKKVDANGGVPQTLVEVSGASVGLGAWNRDGVIVFGSRGNGPMRRVAAAGGKAEDVTAIDSSSFATHAFPAFLPDGRRFLYWRGSTRSELQGVYLGSLDKPADQQDPRMIAAATMGPVALVAGSEGYRLLVFRDGVIAALPFDINRAEVSGDAVTLAEHVGSSGSFGFFSAQAGVFVFRSGAAGLPSNEQLTWIGRKGNSLGTVGEQLPIFRGTGTVTISPNGQQAAVLLVSAARFADVWTLEFARGVATRVTFSDSGEVGPVWSPDGGRLAFRNGTPRNYDIVSKDLNSTAEETPLMTPAMRGIPNDWSADGRFLILTGANDSNTDLFAMDVKSKTAAPLLQSPFNETDARLSPDARTLAYASNESGRFEIYLRPFAVSAEGKAGVGPKFRVSNDGGGSPRWRRDGKELFFRGLGAEVMAVDVVMKDGIVQTSLPHRLFTMTGIGWDVTADGQRFLMSIPAIPSLAKDTSPDPVTVVLNWQSASK